MVTTMTATETQGSNPATFSFQETLPRLPIPTLEETCDQLLQWTSVLLDEDELARSRHTIATFQQPGGIGPKLHEYLELWSK